MPLPRLRCTDSRCSRVLVRGQSFVKTLVKMVTEGSTTKKPNRQSGDLLDARADEEG